jgi:FAD/FMN-containing dehydrogenase
MESRILHEFQTILGHGLIADKVQLHTYECDGLTNFRVLPQAVLLPASTEEVQAVVRIYSREEKFRSSLAAPARVWVEVHCRHRPVS